MKLLKCFVLFMSFLTGINAKSLRCPIRSLNAVANKSIDGMKAVGESLSSLQNNTFHKFDVKKKLDVGLVALNCQLKDSNVAVPSVVRKHIQDPSINCSLYHALQRFNELSLEATFKLSDETSLVSNASFDLPKTFELTLKGAGKSISVDAHTSDILKRLDFILRYRNLILGYSLNLRSKENNIEFLQRLENLYDVNGKYLDVTPKVEVSFAKDGKIDARACLVLKRDGLVITPIIYPFSKQCELAVETKVTDEIKVGMFISKNKDLYLNLTYENYWGSSSWQSLALRFVLSDVLRTSMLIQNEVYL
ncbi:signal peptide-containing protein [Theileria equi strain WA]|uniref:Signal peptide-containing protein n=1 Tax=Theileria equi strain WA TaxID=1537102 RepID=L0AYW8_THEEQ|nr:signal peptide-containing protein [Theileria equi strain WA]AFZ80216.1 signal peptide-containing protein [Theileria equi strain WA]|eukprot:XP_004829882.1 signal peptide-containing protein [Theileria equi strain WA]